MPPKGRGGRKAVAIDVQHGDDDSHDEDMDTPPIMRASALLERLKAIDVANFVMPQKTNVAYLDAGKRRLVIKRMIVRNFKSYFGNVNIGPFHSHFSCIVGANGSGKSNTIDALLFVFGFKASKIRSPNIEALIHKSAEHLNVKECSVEIIFTYVTTEDLKNEFYVDRPPDISICRFVRISERGVVSSVYHLNGSPASMTDVKKFLGMRGVDLEYNRFLILQGEVEFISTLKPKALNSKDQGLLEYLEEVIGTNRYQERVKEVELLVKNLNQTSQDQAERVSKALERKTEFVQPVRDMLKQLILRNRISHAQWRLELVNLRKSQIDIQSSQARFEAVTEELTGKRLAYEKTVAANNASKVAAQNINTNLNKSISKFRNMKTKLENTQLQLKKETTILQNAQKRLKSREKSHQADLDKVTKLTGVPEQKADEVEKLKAELVEVSAKRDALRLKLDGKNAAARNKTTLLANERNVVGRQLANLKRSETQLTSEIELAEASLKGHSEALETAKDNLRTAQNELESVECDVKTTETNVTKLMRDIVECEKQMTALRSRITELEDCERVATAKHEACRIAYNNAEKERFENNEASKSMSIFMREKISGRIPGICGRLGDLGHIDPVYDVAISTNCRGHLDTYIVETIEARDKCLKLVEDNKLGRTRFMVLSIMKNECEGRWRNEVRNSRGFKRLFDYIEPIEERYRVAFYYFLRDMLVCNDLGEARDLARVSNQNVVTIDGNYVSSSGTLTGGGTNFQTSRGYMGVTTNRRSTRQVVPTLSLEQITALKQKVEATTQTVVSVQAELNAVRVELKEMESAFNGSHVKKRRLEEAKQAAEKNLAFFRFNVTEMQQQMKNAESAAADALRTAPEIEAQVKNFEEKRTVLRAEIDNVQLQYEDVSMRIQNVYSEMAGNEEQAFGAAEVREKELEKQMHELRKASKKIEMDLEQCRLNINAAEESLESLHADVEKCLEKQAIVQRSVDELTEAVDLEAQKTKELQEKLTAETARADADNSEEVKLKREITELSDKRGRISSRLEHLQMQVQECQQRRSELKLHVIHDLIASTEAEDDPFGRMKPVLDSGDEFEEHHLETFDDDNFDDRMSETEEHTLNEEPLRPLSFEEDGSNDEMHEEFITMTDEQCDMLDVGLWNDRIRMLEEEYGRIKTPLNMNRLDEFRKRVAEFLVEQDLLKEIRKMAKIFNEACNRLLMQRSSEFNDALKSICMHFKKQYYDLSLGGEADICVPNGGDPYSEGIHMLVRPQNKGWREITQISGGEKTIASLSLVFALHQYQPTPFYIMDEIDAALDYRNVTMISRLVKEKTKNSQFIIISLRNNMQQAANRMICVTKVKDCARVLAYEFQSKRPVKKPPTTFKTDEDVEDADENFSRQVNSTLAFADKSVVSSHLSSDASANSTLTSQENNAAEATKRSTIKDTTPLILD